MSRSPYDLSARARWDRKSPVEKHQSVTDRSIAQIEARLTKIDQRITQIEANLTIQQANKPAQNWETVAKSIKQKNPPQDALLLERPDTVTVAFIGEPFAFEAVWEESNGWVPFDKQKDLHKNIEPARKILINVAVARELAPKIKFTPRYWEMGVDTFKQLVRLRDEHELNDWLFIIVRRDDDDAEPCYDILPDAKMDAETKAKLETLPRICLTTAKNLTCDQ